MWNLNLLIGRLFIWETTIYLEPQFIWNLNLFGRQFIWNLNTFERQFIWNHNLANLLLLLFQSSLFQFVFNLNLVNVKVWASLFEPLSKALFTFEFIGIFLCFPIKCSSAAGQEIHNFVFGFVINPSPVSRGWWQIGLVPILNSWRPYVYSPEVYINLWKDLPMQAGVN